MKIILNDNIIQIDEKDLNKFKEKTWSVVTINGKKYVKNTYREDKRVKTLYLSKYLTGYRTTGYKNDDTLDYRRNNLYNKEKYKIKCPYCLNVENISVFNENTSKRFYHCGDCEKEFDLKKR